jgi:hypothetical protein
MRPEDQLLFLCTRQDFSDKHRQEVTELCHRYLIHWELVLPTAEQHGIAPLVCANLLLRRTLDFGIPQEIADKFRFYTYQNTIEKEKRTRRLEEGCAYFCQRSIDIMLVKGPALDLVVYDYPWYTVSLDNDLILKARREEFNHEDMHAIMDHFHQSGIEYDFFEHHDVSINGTLPIDFDWVWKDAVKIKFRSQDVFIMSPEDMLIALCISSCRKRFFRLKSLFDIAETVRKCSDLDWDKLASKSLTYDCHNIVYTALRVTQRTVGCEIPGGGLDRLRVSPARTHLLESLIGFLLQCTNLSSYPYSGRQVFGRQIHISLVLPYATYRGYQIWRKFGEILHNSR